MKKDDSIYLRHIFDAITTVEAYLSGVNDAEFHSTKLIQDGVIRQIEIIGEAARHVSRELRKTNPGIPWDDISGMRDKLIHDYFGVDLEKVWLTAKEDLSVLKEQITHILENRDT